LATERKRNSRENLNATRRILAAHPPAIELPAEDDRSGDAQVTRMYWLNTKGKELICARLGVKDAVAAVLIHGWLRDAKKDYVAVATIITAAMDLGIEGEAFRNLVAGRIRELKHETRGQRPLPLGLTTVRAARRDRSFAGGAVRIPPRLFVGAGERSSALITVS
jgi:hypothetical protein